MTSVEYSDSDHMCQHYNDTCLWRPTELSLHHPKRRMDIIVSSTITMTVHHCCICTIVVYVNRENAAPYM